MTHLMNFKELSGQELNDLVTEVIEIKHDLKNMISPEK